MKKRLIFIIILMVGVSAAAKSPVVMVAPSEEWSRQMGYMMFYEIEGLNSAIPDYEAAFMMCPEMCEIIFSINKSLVERGFGVRLLEAELKKLTNDQVWNSMARDTEERPLYIAGRMAGVDIVALVSYDLKKEKGRYYTYYRLSAVDLRTRRIIASQSSSDNISGSAADRKEFCRTAHICIIDQLVYDILTYYERTGYFSAK